MDKNIVHGLSSKEDQLASRKSIIHRFNMSSSVMSEPKPACDHIVGHYDDMNGGLNVKLSYLRPDGRCGLFDWFRSFSSKKDRDIDSHYNYCPECGHPIDWDEIEKQLNSTK